MLRGDGIAAVASVDEVNMSALLQRLYQAGHQGVGRGVQAVANPLLGMQ